MPENPRRAEYSLTENVASPFHAEPRHPDERAVCRDLEYGGQSDDSARLRLETQREREGCASRLRPGLGLANEAGRWLAANGVPD
jgi:hypothetical protein